jgi:hypothetical protein
MVGYNGDSGEADGKGGVRSSSRVVAKQTKAEEGSSS